MKLAGRIEGKDNVMVAAEEKPVHSMSTRSPDCRPGRRIN
jgi:hypothetical protein